MQINLKHRFIKLKNTDGTWDEYYVSTGKRLKKILSQPYIDAYISTGKYLDLRNKKFFYYANILLDFDQQERENIIKTIETTLKINELIEKDPRLTYIDPKIEYILNTSRGNYQCMMSNNFILPSYKCIAFKNRNKSEEINRFVINIYRAERKKISAALKKLRLICDWPVLEDSESRVCRIAKSIHRSGFQTKYVTLDEIKTEKAEKILKEKKEKPRMTTTYSTGISNKCPGAKDEYIPVLMYNLERDRNQKKDAAKLQAVYRLGTAYFMNNGEHLITMFLKKVNRQRLQKVINASKACNKRAMQKSKQCFLRITKETKTDTNDIIFPDLQKEGKMIGQENGQSSKEFANFLRIYLGFEVDEKNLAGKYNLPEIVGLTKNRRADGIQNHRTS